jgi:hypothetical protein
MAHTRSVAQVYSCTEHGPWRPPRPPQNERAECATCWGLYGVWHARRAAKVKASQGAHPIPQRKRGRGSKAKGRAGVEAVVNLLREAAPWLGEGDIFIKATSQLGADVHLSPRAREWLDYALEVKNVEALNIWAALRQATANARTCPPLLFFKRARTGLYVALRAEDFLKLLPCPVNGPSDLSLSPSPVEPPASP